MTGMAVGNNAGIANRDGTIGTRPAMSGTGDAILTINPRASIVINIDFEWNDGFFNQVDQVLPVFLNNLCSLC